METSYRKINTAVLLDQVSVEYRVPIDRYVSFKEYAIKKIQGQIRFQRFLALKNISLDVEKGEILGIVGRNGAGKSTLLKLVARILKPTGGKIEVVGQVAPLLGIGAGFHPELTGRENIYLNGTLLGFSRKEMDKRYEAIVNFAGLGDFIDAPFRTYSSGMQARLGFAVAIDVKPNILLIDEVLAVGDEAFQKKCAERIHNFRQQRVTILLASHDMKTIQTMCTRAVWLDQGEIMAIGSVEEVTQKYQRAGMELEMQDVRSIDHP